MGTVTVNQLINKYHFQKTIFIGLMIIVLSALYFLVLSFFSNLFAFYNYLFAASSFMYGFALVSSPLMSMALAVDSTQKGGVSALLGLSMASMARLASLLTALFFQGKPSSSALIIFIFILSGNLTYFVGQQRAHYD